MTVRVAWKRMMSFIAQRLPIVVPPHFPVESAHVVETAKNPTREIL